MAAPDPEMSLLTLASRVLSGKHRPTRADMKRLAGRVLRDEIAEGERNPVRNDESGA